MVDLAEIMTKLRAEKRSVEMECVLQDFLELPHNDQAELLFVELAKAQSNYEALWDRIKVLEEANR